MTLEEGFLSATLKRFVNYKELGDKTFAQLDDTDFLFRPNEQSNSIAIIVQHMHGNMVSRFTRFLTEDGEKGWRRRDAEFDDAILSKEQTLNLWGEGWKCLFDALQSLQPADLMKTIYIRTAPLIVFDAILRQLAHYANHVGQIQFIGKMIKGEKWQSLSIPKGESNQFSQMPATQNKLQ